jgi:hypothetical protein
MVGKGYLYKLWDGGPDGVARRRSWTEWPDGEARRSGPTEKPSIPNGRAGQTDTRMGAQRRVDGRPTEGIRVPDGDREWPDRGRGLGGWPNGGLYKGWWPSFLGTLFLCPITPARNAGAQGANE